MIGFWAVPYQQTYIKLPIRDSYRAEGNPVKTISEGQVNASWAVLANLDLLSKHFPWVKESVYKIIKGSGQDVFANPQHRLHQQALQQLQKAAMDNDWVFVVSHSNGEAYVGMRWMPAYSQALVTELTDPTQAQNPTKYSVGKIHTVIGISPGGQPQSAKTLEDFFHSHAASPKSDPIQAFLMVAKKAGVDPAHHVGPNTKPDDVNAVRQLVDAVAQAAKQAGIDQRPEIKQAFNSFTQAAEKNFDGFAAALIKNLHGEKAAAPQPEGPGLHDLVGEVIEILDAYSQPDNFKEPKIRDFAAKLYANPKAVNELYVVMDHEHSLKLRQFLMAFARWWQQNKHNVQAPRVPPPTAPPPSPHPVESHKRGLTMSEATFRQLYQATGANGLYKEGGMRKVTTTGGEGQVHTHWIFDPSVPGRVDNSKFVVTKPPTPTTGPDGLTTVKFNFKSRPDRSTTNMRAVGFIKFLPQVRRGRPATEVDREVHVYCSCPDFKYRWHKALADKGAAHVPTGIGGEATNQEPLKTNPGKKMAICKHLCAMYDYLGQKKADYLSAMGHDAGRVSKTGKSVIPVAPGKAAKIKQGAKVNVKATKSATAKGADDDVPTT